MADPLLTSLCAICHISAPRYKCPRCSIRTCSLACIKKHKAWSECTGERDATAYVPTSKLRTPAGIDHDYNFLHGIELSVERSEKLLVGERKLVQEEELRPMTVQEVKWKPGRDGRKRKVLVTRVLREAKGRTFERLLSQRLKKLNIGIVCAPMGMTRQKENNTTFNRRTGRVNWQVEWMTFAPTDEIKAKENEEEGDGETPTHRALSKVMDDVPLYQAYHAFLEEQEKVNGQPHKRGARVEHGGQDPSNAVWYGESYSLHDPFSGTWATCRGADIAMWPYEKEETERRRFQFFLARPRTRSDLPSSLTQLQPDDCFREILANTRILEFPTIYVVNDGDTLPPGFVLGPKDTVLPQGSNKRKNPPGKKNSGKSAKRNKHGGNDVEEGEVGSEEEAGNSDGDEVGGTKGVALEAGDVIGEQSLGEEEEEDDDDSTSSSGSDSD